MALLTESEVRARAQRAVADDKSLRKAFYARSSGDVLVERAITLATATKFDMFLSHSFADAEVVLGVTCILQDLGYTPYVDWIQDAHLNRRNVTPATAQILRTRMKDSASLFYVTTTASSQSKWMPWECGYMDGLRGKCAILPIASQYTSKYQGQEYLGLYPFSTVEKSKSGKVLVYIYKSDNSGYTLYDNWVKKNDSEIDWWQP